LEGEKLEQPKLLDVTWTENMTFDGLAAKFYGTVRAVLDESSMRCEEMHVLLNRRISFTESNRQPQDKVDVQNVHCIDNVEFDSSVYEQQKLVELRKGWFAEFSMNQATGETRAQGPGLIKVWRRGGGNRAALAPAATVRANKPLESDVSDWEFMQIKFSHRSQGNLKERHTSFDDRVTIVYGPVDRPLAEIDLDAMGGELPENAGSMQCAKLQIVQNAGSGARKSYIELVASGNAMLEGRTFTARAETVSYDESKGLYVLKSFGSGKASVWRQKQIGTPSSQAVGQSIMFIPSQNFLKVDNATTLDGLQ
jgi:hypothetical protein